MNNTRSSNHKNHRATLALAGLAALLASVSGGNQALGSELPDLSVVDTGPDVIVVARHLELGNDALKVRGNRIEVALDGKPPAASVDIDDATIASLGIRIRSTGERRLTITLKGGRDAARRLARRAKVEQVAGSVQLILARENNIDPVAAFIEAPTDMLAGDDGGNDIEIEDDEDEEMAAAASTEASATEAPPAATPVPTKSGSAASSIIGLLFIFGAALACGLGYREWQKRRAASPMLSGIEVLSMKNIGPKTRLMLVAVGNREMLLTVGPTGSTVLGRWRRNESALVADDDLGFPADAMDPYDQQPLAPARPLAAPPREARPLAAPPREARPLPTAPPRRRAASRAERSVNPAAAALARRTQEAAPEMRRSFARGSANPATQGDAIAEWNHRPTSPAIRGILELTGQTLALDDVLGQGDDDIDTEWEQALAGGTRAGRLR